MTFKLAKATKVVRKRTKKSNGDKVLVKKTTKTVTKKPKPTKKVTAKPQKMGKCPTCNKDY